MKAKKKEIQTDQITKKEMYIYNLKLLNRRWKKMFSKEKSTKKPISKANLLSQKIDKIFMEHGLKVTEVQKTGSFITNSRRTTKE